jgi:hypothetical protein
VTRYDQYGALDDQPKPLGDRTFIGVNMRLDPALLPPGYVSDAVNMRFRNGIAETRKGFIFPPWANKTTTGTIAAGITRSGSTATATTVSPHSLATNSVAVISGATQPEYNGTFIVTVTGATTFTYPVAGSPATPATGSPVLNTYNTQPWGEVHGVGVFSDPYTLQEYLIIAAGGQVYYTQPNNAPQQMTLPTGVTLAGRVEFTQAFDVLLMHRGASEPTLMLPRITQPWQLVDQTPSGNGTEAIPNATHSLFLQNRLFIPNDHDEIAVSDLNDYTRYVPVLQEFKINQGSADELVAVTKFNDTTIIALKEHSIYALSNVYGNLSALQQDELTSEFGCVARKSIAHVGKDLWFLSELGVMSITQTEQNKLQGVVLPVSDPIQPLIDRINWKYASGATAQVWDSKYYLAVPLDDAEVLGPEIADGRMALWSPNTVIGATYRFIKGGDTDFLVNGTTTYTRSTDFVAVDVVVDLANYSQAASLRRVAKAVNNACLVYDFLNGAWSGYDTADQFSWREHFRFTVSSVRRLLSVTHDGWVALLEEDYEDQLAVPYTDVLVTASPSAGDTIKVNTGVTITAFASATNSLTPPNWGNGLGNATVAATNLYVDSGTGYAENLFLGSWGASDNAESFALGGNVTPTGVRFYASNGVTPVVATTGSWATVVPNATQPVIATLTTRGYASDVLALDDFDWLTVDLQTWAPQTSIDLVTTGVNEEQAILTDQTRDRTAYYEPSDAAAFDLDNDNGDFLTPYRQDYSVLLGSGTGAAADFALHTTVEGVALGLHQEARITERSNASGRAALVRLTNEQGRMRVMAVALETNEDNFSAGTKA